MRFLWPLLGIGASWWIVVRCAGESDASTVSEIPQWTLAAQPSADIGIESGDPMYELTDVASAARLIDGTIIVADAGVDELRWFDSTGRFLFVSPPLGAAVAGGQRRQIHPVSTGSSHVAVLEMGDRRFSLNWDGRATVLPPAPTAPRIVGRTLLLGGTSEARERAVRVVGLLPPVDSGAGHRVAHVDRLGFLWIESPALDAAGRHAWTIVDGSGTVVGRAMTPAAFEPHDIGLNQVTGRWRDGNDIDHVRVYGLSRDERLIGTERAPTPSLAPVSRHASAVRRRSALAALRETLQELALLQDGHWARTLRYSTDARLFELRRDERIDVVILSATVAGWRGIAIDRSADAMCLIAVGRETPPGFFEGTPICE